LADLFGAHLTKPDPLHPEKQTIRGNAGNAWHTYLRVSPELRGKVDGPKTGTEPTIQGERHPVFKGFDETDILPFGGLLEPLHVDAGAKVLMTYIPQFPAFPPETAWMREPKTDVPGLIINTGSGGRVAFLPADIDRQFSRYNLPDHGNLLANPVRWASGDNIPLVVEGAGLIDCHLYRQPGRFILHLVNLTSAGTWRQPVEELIPVGPLKVGIKLNDQVRGNRIQTLVSKQKISATVEKGWRHFKVESVLDHEVLIIW
jgi:hypothetical protein